MDWIVLIFGFFSVILLWLISNPDFPRNILNWIFKDNEDHNQELDQVIEHVTNRVNDFQTISERLDKAVKEREDLRKELQSLVDDRDLYVENIMEYTSTEIPKDRKPKILDNINNARHSSTGNITYY